MPLTDGQVAELGEAIASYAFPPVYFDFTANAEVRAHDMGMVEISVMEMMTAKSVDSVRDGLANVLYWGYAQMPVRDFRVRRFLQRVSLSHLSQFKELVETVEVPSLRQVASIRIPEYSGVSFISKVLMFLDPVRYCVLDRQLAKLARRPGSGGRALDRLTVWTTIPATRANQLVYDEWRKECSYTATHYFAGERRAVDIERGFFQLVQTRRLPLARAIYEGI